MSQSNNNQNDVSDVKQAAEKADANKIEKNLSDKTASDVPEPLDDEQQTPFIDEDVRTDK